MNNQELIEFDKETQRLQNEVDEHLSKFQDLDKLFENTKWIIQRFFEEQDKYKDLDLFIQYLKEEVIFYVSSFKLTRKERKIMRERLDYIEETYNELIYFWELNPIKARFERLANQTKEEKEIDKQRWYFWWLIAKVIWK